MRYKLFILFFAFSVLNSFSQEYLIFNNSHALNRFASIENYEDIAEWVSNNNGVSIKSISTENELWCPNKDELNYVVYSYKSLLRVWFQVDYENKNSALRKLNSLLENSSFKKNRNDFLVYPVIFQEGSCLESGEFMSHSTSISKLTANKIETIDEFNKIGSYLKDNKIFTEFPRQYAEMSSMQSKVSQYQNEVLNGTEIGGMVDSLKRKYNSSDGLGNGNESGSVENGDKSGSSASNEDSGNIGGDDGNESSSVEDGDKSGSSPSDGDTGNIGGGDGKPGIFDTDASFSKWVVSIADALATYFGIKEMSMQALMVLYVVAPDLVTDLGTSLAKLQRQMTDDLDVDDFLNEISDIYDEAIKIYDLYKSVEQIYNDPDFDILKDKFDFGKIDTKKALELVSEHSSHPLTGILKQMPNMNSKDIAEKVKEVLIKEATKRITDKIKKETGVDVSPFANCYQQDEKNSDCIANATRKTFVNNAIPEDYKDAFKHIANEDYEKAATAQIKVELKKRGIDTNPEELATAIQNGNTKQLASIIIDSQKDKLGSAFPLIKKAANGQKITDKDLIESGIEYVKKKNPKVGGILETGNNSKTYEEFIVETFKNNEEFNLYKPILTKLINKDSIAEKDLIKVVANELQKNNSSRTIQDFTSIANNSETLSSFIKKVSTHYSESEFGHFNPLLNKVINNKKIFHKDVINVFSKILIDDNKEKESELLTMVTNSTSLKDFSLKLYKSSIAKNNRFENIATKFIEGREIEDNDYKELLLSYFKHSKDPVIQKIGKIITDHGLKELDDVFIKDLLRESGDNKEIIKEFINNDYKKSFSLFLQKEGISDKIQAENGDFLKAINKEFEKPKRKANERQKWVRNRQNLAFQYKMSKLISEFKFKQPESYYALNTIKSRVVQKGEVYKITFYTYNAGLSNISPGHAFYALGRESNIEKMSISDGAWGFYPDLSAINNIDKLNIVKKFMSKDLLAVIFLEIPGIVKDDSYTTSDNFYQIEVTKEIYDKLIEVEKIWKNKIKNKKYQILFSDCVSMIAEVAKEAGLELPDRLMNPLPQQYIKALIKENK